MKKSLIALAAVAAVGAASAQSSVTLYGVLDAAYNNLSATNAGSLSRVTGNGGNQSSRIGFRGVEDLGGGLKASFVLEAGINVDNGTGFTTTGNNMTLGQSATTGSGTGANAFAGNASSSASGQQGLTFNRRSTVSLEGSFGEVRLGRDLTPTFLNLAAFDPFGAVGVGAATNVTLGFLNPIGVSVAPPGSAKATVRSSNSLQYFTPNFAGFRAGVMYAFSESPSNCTALGNAGNPGSGASTLNSCPGAAGDGKYFGVRGLYNNGPISASVAFGKNSFKAGDAAIAAAGLVTGGVPAAGGTPFRGDGSIMNLGGSYNFGVATAMAQYGTMKQQANLNQAVATDQKLTHYLLGVSVPMGAGEFKASYNWGKLDKNATATENTRRQNQLALGYVHNLSKRTALYTTYSRLNASGAGAVASMGLSSTAVAATGGSVSASGYDIGVRHSF